MQEMSRSEWVQVAKRINPLFDPSKVSHAELHHFLGFIDGDYFQYPEPYRQLQINMQRLLKNSALERSVDYSLVADDLWLFWEAISDISTELEALGSREEDMKSNSNSAKEPRYLEDITSKYTKIFGQDGVRDWLELDCQWTGELRSVYIWAVQIKHLTTELRMHYNGQATMTDYQIVEMQNILHKYSQNLATSLEQFTMPQAAAEYAAAWQARHNCEY